MSAEPKGHKWVAGRCDWCGLSAYELVTILESRLAAANAVVEAARVIVTPASGRQGPWDALVRALDEYDSWGDGHSEGGG